MTALLTLVESLWSFIVLHLWQTTLILGGLLLLSVPLRKAPARFTHILWTAGLLKLLLPLSIFGDFLPSIFQGSISPSNTSPLLPTYMAVIGVLNSPAEFTVTMWLSPLLIVCVTGMWLIISGYLLFRIFHRGFRHSGPPGLSLSVLRSEDARSMAEIAKSAGIEPCEIVVTEETVMPSVIGLFNQKMILPMGLMKHMSRKEIEAILVHENAHRMRFDTLWLFLQSVIQSLFFFYPILIPLIRKLRTTAEMACDERVLSHGIEARTYLGAIIRSLQFGPAPAGFSSAVVGRKSSFHHRLQRIISYRRQTTMRRYYAIIGMAFIIVLCGSIIPMPTQAGTTESSNTNNQDKEFVEFTEAPKPVHTVAPVYPERAKIDGVCGTVYVDIYIDTRGTVTETGIKEGIDGYPEFGEAAENALRQWKFKPAELDGDPVAVWVVIPVKFALDTKSE